MRRSSIVKITQERMARILSIDLPTYRTHYERAAMRAALGDAATLCDAMAGEVLIQNTRGGRTTKATREMAAAFTRCGDEIMEMRKMIAVPR